MIRAPKKSERHASGSNKNRTGREKGESRNSSVQNNQKWDDPGLIEYATLVGRDHVLDVDEGVHSSVNFEELERLLNEISNILSLALTIVDRIALRNCIANRLIMKCGSMDQQTVLVSEKIKNGQNLTIVRY